ncbi:hemolysin family protein [Alterisphingorhabdus coralli]|uniref:Hemolysin family protein n=1 Tax=Alterisphingorhabdus coralli TaxID=3071408 RepID=A0AA97I1I9_9SPHN|nr:hemolysin family protein [Parasphingorhabdus sp. SCSIO 66989]WOE76082.1 hemolysin family protein [Parasphingorhabdus sp. SCSIO 66989]
MPEADSSRSQTAQDEEDSSGQLWRSIKSFFTGQDRDQSLRQQLEEAIDEHEDNGGAAPSQPNGDLSPLEREMLRNLLHFSEHDADDVAVPRSEVVAIPTSASFQEVVDTFSEHGHSRIPVYKESLDDIIGMIHIKDVFAILAKGCDYPDDWSDLIRQPRFVPQSMGALDMLADMRKHRTHLAIVLDEYSGTDGIVTIEDLVEEIVGEIEDEHDEEPEDMLIRQDDGSWDADARTELDDVATQIDPRLAEIDEDVDTLGGLAFVLAGEVPSAGQTLEHPSGWTIHVLESDGRRVSRLNLRYLAKQEAPADKHHAVSGAK